MTEARGPIQWQRMDRHWWLESVVRLLLLGAICTPISFLFDPSVKWELGVSLFLILTVILLLAPRLPREGEERLSLKHSIYVLGSIALVVVGIGALIIAFFTVPHLLKPVLDPFIAWIVQNFTLDTVLLLFVIILLSGIHQKLDRIK